MKKKIFEMVCIKVQKIKPRKYFQETDCYQKIAGSLLGEWGSQRLVLDVAEEIMGKQL